MLQAPMMCFSLTAAYRCEFMEQKLSKYDAKPEKDGNYCANCYYYAEGFCTKEQNYIEVTEPNTEYCSEYAESIILSDAAESKKI